mgnify:CR=1 FL=1
MIQHRTLKNIIRAIGVGPQVNVVKYDPDAPLHARYVVDFNYLAAAEHERAIKTCRTLAHFRRFAAHRGASWRVP